MRRWRSFLAMTSSAPSSTFLRPIFQASATRSENCSIASPSVVGTISTAIWLPLRFSRSASVCVSCAISPLDSVPVWSTTRPVSWGTATSAMAGSAQPNNKASRTARAAFIANRCLTRSLGGCRSRAEIHLRCNGDFLLVGDREVGLLLVAEHHGRQIVREGADADIIVLHRLDVTVARHGDAVLGAFQLRHQVLEQRVRFELRIIFGDDQEPRQRARELALRLGEFLEGGGIVQHLGRRLDAADLGASIGDAEQYVLFLLRKALHGIDEVRHEIGAALVLVDY